MKKTLFVALLLLGAVTSHMAYAQNLQLHYKTAKWLYPREWANDAMLMSTVEMFKADPWGDTFFFVDMTYTKEGLNYAYWEIARNLKFWEAPFAVHLEYNGGLQGPFLFNHAYLAGGTYALHSKDFSKTFYVPSLRFSEICLSKSEKYSFLNFTFTTPVAVKSATVPLVLFLAIQVPHIL